MLVKMPYGKRTIEVRVPDRAKVVYPRQLPGVDDLRTEIRRVMADPIGGMPLRQLALGKSDAAVVINDITRPAPSKLMLKEIVSELEAAGKCADKITVIIACGNHRPSPPKEIRQMVSSELASRLRIINHNCEDEANLAFLGQTDKGLPIWINSYVAKASVKVLTGIITPHQSAGYTGGRKSIMPGVAGLETLRKHHSFPLRPFQPASGWMKGNPFHEEAVQAARVVGVDFILNVVKNSRGQVVEAVAGELEAAHERGVRVCEQNWVIGVPRKYDIVVATPGGHPQDINLHQAQKAISTAENVIEDDGVIVLVAECSEGIGKFGDWLKHAGTPGEVIERFKSEGFTRQHSSKAFMCARALEKHTIIVSCSGIGQDELEQMFFSCTRSAQAAIDTALGLKGPDSSVLVMPYAANALPVVDS